MPSRRGSNRKLEQAVKRLPRRRPGRPDPFRVSGNKVRWHDDEWNVEATLDADAEGRLVIRELSLKPRRRARSSPPDGGVTSSTMRSIPVGQMLARATAYAEQLRGLLPSLVGATERPRAERIEEAVPKRRGRKPYPDKDVRRIAHAYLDLLEQGVTRGILTIIAEREKEETTRVRDHLKAARKKGYIVGQRQGAAGGVAGPELAKERKGGRKRGSRSAKGK